MKKCLASARRNDPIVRIDREVSKEIHQDNWGRPSFIFTRLTSSDSFIGRRDITGFYSAEIQKRYTEVIQIRKQKINHVLAILDKPIIYKDTQVSAILLQIEQIREENGDKLINFITKINS